MPIEENRIEARQARESRKDKTGGYQARESRKNGIKICRAWNGERMRLRPIEHVNREENQVLIKIFGNLTRTSGKRTSSQKSSHYQSRTHQQGFKGLCWVIRSQRSCESSNWQSALSAGPESASRKTEKGPKSSSGQPKARQGNFKSRKSWEWVFSESNQSNREIRERNDGRDRKSVV